MNHIEKQSLNIHNLVWKCASANGYTDKDSSVFSIHEHDLMMVQDLVHWRLSVIKTWCTRACGPLYLLWIKVSRCVSSCIMSVFWHEVTSSFDPTCQRWTLNVSDTVCFRSAVTMWFRSPLAWDFQHITHLKLWYIHVWLEAIWTLVENSMGYSGIWVQHKTRRNNAARRVDRTITTKGSTYNLKARHTDSAVGVHHIINIAGLARSTNEFPDHCYPIIQHPNSAWTLAATNIHTRYSAEHVRSIATCSCFSHHISFGDADCTQGETIHSTMRGG